MGRDNILSNNSKVEQSNNFRSKSEVSSDLEDEIVRLNFLEREKDRVSALHHFLLYKLAILDDLKKERSDHLEEVRAKRDNMNRALLDFIKPNSSPLQKNLKKIFEELARQN